MRVVLWMVLAGGAARAEGPELSADTCAVWFGERARPRQVCGMLTMPDGPQLAVTLLHPEERRGVPVLYGQGGPAAPHVEWSWAEDPVVDALLEAGRPVVFFDTRGSGKSELRLDCPPLHDVMLAAIEQPDNPVLHGRVHTSIQDCALLRRARQPAMHGWSSAVDDAITVREELEIEAWDAVGISAGSTYVLDLATRTHSGVRRVVVSGVPTDASIPLDVPLDAIVQSCQRDPACPLDDPEGVLRAGLSRLTDLPQTAAPPETGLSRSRGGALVAIRSALYSGEEAGRLLSVMRDVETGGPDALGRWWDMDLRYFWDDSAMLAIAVQRCTRFGGVEVDPPARSSRPLLDELVRPRPDDHDDVCTELGFDAEVRPDWSTIDAPTLAIHGAWDPVTPPRGADTLLSDVPDLVQHTLDGRSHDALDDPCATQLMVAHLDGHDATEAPCLATVRPAWGIDNASAAWTWLWVGLGGGGFVAALLAAGVLLVRRRAADRRPVDVERKT